MQYTFSKQNDYDAKVRIKMGMAKKHHFVDPDRCLKGLSPPPDRMSRRHLIGIAQHRFHQHQKTTQSVGRRQVVRPQNNFSSHPIG